MCLIYLPVPPRVNFPLPLLDNVAPLVEHFSNIARTGSLSHWPQQDPTPQTLLALVFGEGLHTQLQYFALSLTRRVLEVVNCYHCVCVFTCRTVYSGFQSLIYYTQTAEKSERKYISSRSRAGTDSGRLDLEIYRQRHTHTNVKKHGELFVDIIIIMNRAQLLW